MAVNKGASKSLRPQEVSKDKNSVAKCSAQKLALRIGRSTVTRLIKPTKDNLLGIGVGALAVLVSAHSHRWSGHAIWMNAWETLVLPWVLGFCFLLALHVVQSAKVVYSEETVPFQNMLGGVTKLPPPDFRLRFYPVAFAYLLLPFLIAYFAWQKNNPEVSSEIASPSNAAVQVPADKPLTGFIQLGDLFFRSQNSVVKAGRKLELNASYIDRGSEPLQDVFGWTNVVTIDHPGFDADRRANILNETVMRSVRNDYFAGRRKGTDVGVGGGIWGTFTVKILDRKQAEQIMDGTFRIYYFGWVAWKDYEGRQQSLSQCRWLQNPSTTKLTKQDTIWHACIL